MKMGDNTHSSTSVEHNLKLNFNINEKQFDQESSKRNISSNDMMSMITNGNMCENTNVNNINIGFLSNLTNNLSNKLS